MRIVIVGYLCSTNVLQGKSMRLHLLLSMILLVFGVIPSVVQGQQNCPAVDDVKKWEVVSAYKLLAYDRSDKYWFFLNCYDCVMQQGGKVILRFFSSTICPNDNVMVNGKMARVSSLEGIRQ